MTARWRSKSRALQMALLSMRGVGLQARVYRRAILSQIPLVRGHMVRFFIPKKHVVDLLVWSISEVRIHVGPSVVTGSVRSERPGVHHEPGLTLSGRYSFHEEFESA